MKNIWVIDDDENWLKNISGYVENSKGALGESVHVKSFATVDDALKELDKITPEEWPDLISTDGDTKSKFSGVDLAERLNNTRVGVVVVSGDMSTPKELAQRGCSDARYVDKPMINRQEFYKLANEAMDAAQSPKAKNRFGDDNNLPGSSNKGI